MAVINGKWNGKGSPANRRQAIEWLERQGFSTSQAAKIVDAGNRPSDTNLKGYGGRARTAIRQRDAARAALPNAGGLGGAISGAARVAGGAARTVGGVVGDVAGQARTVAGQAGQVTNPPRRTVTGSGGASTPASGSRTSTGGGITAGTTSDPVIFAATKPGSATDFAPGTDGMTPEMRLIVSKIIWESGGKVGITPRGGFRSREQQQVLYDKYKAGTGNLAAKPGTSRHEHGTAVDFSGDLALAATLAKKYGLSATVKGEPWHFSMGGPEGSGGGGTGSGGQTTTAAATSATGGTTEVPDLPPNSTKEQTDAYIRRWYPQAAGFLNIPEIAAIFTAPGADEMDSIELEAKLRATDYWQTHGAPSRALDALYGSDKQAADALVTGVKRTFKDLFARNGVTLTDEQSSLYARKMLRAGYVNLQGQILDDDAISDLLATHLRVAKVFADAGVPLTAGAADGETTEQRIVRITGEVQSGKRTIEDVTKSVGRISVDPSQRTTGGGELGGELANNADAMVAKARQFLVPISRTDAEAWSLRILDGSASQESFTAWLTGLAKARYASQPDILAAIEGGLTPSQYFASHQSTVASLLELSPDQIDLLDPKWSWMTETVDKNGNRRAPTLGEVQQMARDRPEFANTRQYKELSSGYALEMSKFIGASA